MTTVENNTIIHTISRGLASSIIIKGLDWSAYTEIICQFKKSNRLEDKAIVTLSTDATGVTISNDQLILTLSEADTVKIKSDKLFFDIKLINNGEVVAPIIPGQLIVNQSITNQWS